MDLFKSNNYKYSLNSLAFLTKHDLIENKLSLPSFVLI